MSRAEQLKRLRESLDGARASDHSDFRSGSIEADLWAQIAELEGGK